MMLVGKRSLGMVIFSAEVVLHICYGLSENKLENQELELNIKPMKMSKQNVCMFFFFLL